MLKYSVKSIISIITATLVISAFTVSASFAADEGYDPDEVLATIGGDKLTNADLDEMLSTMDQYQKRSFEGKSGRRYLLDIMIKNEIMLKAAKRDKLDKDAAIKKQIEEMTERIIISEYFRREIGGKLGISDDEVQAYYNAHLNDYEIPETLSLYHILSETEAEALVAKDKAKAGADFETLAKELSVDNYTAGGGGLLGSISRGYTPFQVGDCPGFEAAVFALNIGDVSDPVQSDKGYHIFWVKNKTEKSHKELNPTLASTIRNNMLVSDGEVKDYFDRNKAGYVEPEKVKISRIVLKTKADANKALARAKAGEDFGTLAELLTIDKPGKDKKGSIGWVRKGGFIQGIGTDEAYENLAFSLGKGEIGGPIEMPDGWHVVKADDKREYREIPLEEVAETIENQLLTERRQERIDGAYTDLEGDYNVRRFSWARTYDDMTLQELQAEAEGTVSATTRIEIYDKIIERFPNEDSADNALLMAGFIYSEELSDYETAADYFKRIIAEYPNSENIDSAQWMLDNMGKDVIEIPEIKE